jgi:hypothetical protein
MPPPTPQATVTPVQIPPQLYEQMTQEIYNDVLRQVKGEMQQKYEVQRVALMSKVRDFINETQITIAELARQVADVEGTTSNLGRSLQETSRKLKQSIERFETHGF